MKSPRLRYCSAVLLVVFLLTPCFGAAKAKPKSEDWNMVPKSVVELRKIESKVEALVEKVTPAIVSIQIGKSRGTGIIISNDGLVLTAAHVVKKPGTPAVVTTTDKKKYAGIALGTFGSVDAGMLKITTKRKDMPHVQLGDSEKMKPGTWCVAMGHPLGYKADRTPVVRIGRVLLNQANIIQTDCPLISGDSGGPLFDLDGKLVGINSKIGMVPSMNFHVPIKVFQDNWDKLKKGDNFTTNLPLRSDKKIAKSFEPLIKKAAECVVQIRCDKKNKILGTIVGPDGWILTKASELKGRIVCRLPDGRDLEARIVGLDPNFDCAMLKVDAVDLPSIPWDVRDPKRGQWVAVPGLDKKPIVYGVVGTTRHMIPKTRGFLGIEMDDKVKDKVVIKKVVPKGPANAAGIKAGDVITHIDGKKVTKSIDAINLIKVKQPGQSITVKIQRG
ncbi:MAG: trypsin-like peptidase domain-containing protein, partial [Planctomycetia bacterium]